MTDILRCDGAVLYHSDTWNTRAEAAEEAVQRGVSLAGADLRGANLLGVDLYRANLRGADLRGADCRDAELAEVSFRYADLRGANVEAANLDNACLIDADLTGITGYVRSYEIFAEVVSRQPIATFNAAERVAIGDVLLNRPCWRTIRWRYHDVAPRILDVLAEAGFTEWRDYWRASSVLEVVLPYKREELSRIRDFGWPEIPASVIDVLYRDRHGRQTWNYRQATTTADRLAIALEEINRQLATVQDVQP
jgi:hypothetical protein